MSSKVYCLIICNSKEGRGGKQRGKEVSRGKRGREEGREGSIRKKITLYPPTDNRKISFNIFHKMQ